MRSLPPRNRVYNVGESVGDFEILEVLDDGSFGRAYKVRWALLPTVELALKVYKPHVSAEAVRREVRAHEHILHPNVARLLDSGVTADGNTYLLTELVDGQTLAQIFEWPDEGGQFDLCEGLLIAWQLLSATRTFHASPPDDSASPQPESPPEIGIVHRDLTPRNILVNESLVAKIIDFGIASPIGTMVKTSTATAGFLPPGWDGDDARNARVWEPWIDVFQIGSVVYRALTGKLPYVHGVPRPLSELMEQCPSDVDDLLARSVSTDPATRFGSAAEMLELVEGAISRNGCEEPPRPSVAQPSDAAIRVWDRLSAPNSVLLPYIDNLTADVAMDTILAIVRAEGPATRSRLLRQVAGATELIAAEVAAAFDLAIAQLLATGQIYQVDNERVDHPGACFATDASEAVAMRRRGEREVWEIPAHELEATLVTLLDEYATVGSMPVEAQITSDLAFVLDVPDWSFDAVIVSAAVSLALENYEPPDRSTDEVPREAVRDDLADVVGAAVETPAEAGGSPPKLLSRLRARWSRSREQA